MRKLLTILFLTSLPPLVAAQTFLRAPQSKPPIKQIIEWTTFTADQDEPEETIKEAVYTFRRDGQLQQIITNNDHNEIFDYEYDGQNRLIRKLIKTDLRTRTMTYQYFSDHQMAEIEEPETDLRTIQYFNPKGQVIEEKSFWKGELSNGQWATLNRTVFNYNKRDSLFGEMLYQPGKDGKVEQIKTIHQYDPVNQLKTAMIVSGPKGKVLKKTAFQYDTKQRLTKRTTTDLESGETTVEEFMYRDDKLWQTITKGSQYRHERVYKEGRLVRSKEFNKTGQLLWFTDYQYIYF